MQQVPHQRTMEASAPLRWHRGKPGENLDVNRPLVRRISASIKADNQAATLSLLRDWPPVDIMDLLVQLPLKRARRLYHWLPKGPAVRVLVEISPGLRAVLMEESGVKRVAEIVEGMDQDDAVQLLGELPQELVDSVLPKLSDVETYRQRLSYDEDTAGAIMSNKFVAVLSDWNVGQATRQIRRRAKEIQTLYEIYVVNEDRRLVGRLRLRDMLLHGNKEHVCDVMHTVPAFASADEDQNKILATAEKYDLVTIPVVDAEHRVIGRVTVDELKEVVRREAEEDMKLMSGVSPDARADEPVSRIVRGRLPWLLGGLVGASLAAMVVGGFEEELEKAAILATFIPIVMAMAGNAGIQASTVTVQGLAAGTLWIGDIGWRIGRELLGSLLNGLAVAVILASLIMVAANFVPIQAPARLALAAGLSLTIVTMMAATFGSTIPLILHYFKIDPAMATGVFITTSNDILGVLIFFVIVTAIYVSGIDPEVLAALVP